MSCVPCVAIYDTARHKAAFVVAAACPGYDGPNGAKKSVDEVERQPLLLIHGISLSSTSWVVNGRDESLGFVLADEGYDV
jgi:pimeloyl-ACP methyl ester carboxylesterase